MGAVHHPSERVPDRLNSYDVPKRPFLDVCPRPSLQRLELLAERQLLRTRSQGGDTIREVVLVPSRCLCPGSLTE